MNWYWQKLSIKCGYLILVNKNVKQTKELAVEIEAALYASPVPKGIMVTSISRLVKCSKLVGAVYGNILDDGGKIYG